MSSSEMEICKTCDDTAIIEKSMGSFMSVDEPPADDLPEYMDISNMFECIWCKQFTMPPIQQCVCGHIVCNDCRRSVVFCPQCKKTLGRIRNLALEKIGNLMRFPCSFANMGCEASLRLEEKDSHEDTCGYHQYRCPKLGGLYTKCKWTGYADEVVPHLREAHCSIDEIQSEDALYFINEVNRNMPDRWVMLQSCFGETFVFVVKKREHRYGFTQYFAKVELIGTRQKASSFKYKISMNSLFGQKRVWNETVSSIEEEIPVPKPNIPMKRNCVIFDHKLARSFVDGSGSLPINLSIYRIKQ